LGLKNVVYGGTQHFPAAWFIIYLFVWKFLIPV
jgi:hypothetical protein